jgi:hypothetical protein
VEGEGEEVRGGDGEGTGPGEMVGEVSYQLRQVFEVSSLCRCENKGIGTNSVILGLTVYLTGWVSAHAPPQHGKILSATIIPQLSIFS